MGFLDVFSGIGFTLALTPGSAGVPPASREPKTGIRRRDASAPRNCAPVQGFQARIRSGKSYPRPDFVVVPEASYFTINVTR
jgi:hypothetical protein